MSTRIGGHTADMLALKSNFERQSGTIDTLRTELRNQLTNTDWDGRAADAFRASWADYERVLIRMAGDLADAAREVQARVQMLQDADA